MYFKKWKQNEKIEQSDFCDFENFSLKSQLQFDIFHHLAVDTVP